MNRRNWRRSSSWPKRCDITPPDKFLADDLGRVGRLTVGVADAYGNLDVEVLFAGTTVIDRTRSTHRVKLFPMAIRTDEHEIRAVQHGTFWLALFRQSVAPWEPTLGGEGYEGWRRRADSNR